MTRLTLIAVAVVVLLAAGHAVDAQRRRGGWGNSEAEKEARKAGLLFTGTNTGFPPLPKGNCACAIYGEPHHLMCDGKTRYNWMGLGLYQVFKGDDGQGKDIEIQCEYRKLRPNDKRQVSVVGDCRIKVTKDGCNFNALTKGGKRFNSMTIYGKKVPLTQASRQQIPASLGIKVETKRNAVRILIETAKGQVAFSYKGYILNVQAPGFDKCTGMCGSCSGNDQKPADPLVFTQMTPITSEKESCGKNTTSTPAPTTPAATTAAPTTPAPTTPAATTAAPTTPASTTPSPTTPSPTSNQTYTPPTAVAPDAKKVIAHPVFESKKVLEKVVKQCLCGQPAQRMKDDKLFGGFVEDCVYDKSVGPDFAAVAESTMQAYVSSVGAQAASLNTSAVAEPAVTKKSGEIPADQGVSYVLQYSKPDLSNKDPEYLPRKENFKFGGEIAERPHVPQQPNAAAAAAASSGAGAVQMGSGQQRKGAAIFSDKLKLKVDLQAPVVVIA